VQLDNETLFSVWQHAGGDEQPYWIVVGGFWNPFPSVPVAVHPPRPEGTGIPKPHDLNFCFFATASTLKEIWSYVRSTD
jgi:hypothetical protein